jgi:hypothetical protein
MVGFDGRRATGGLVAFQGEVCQNTIVLLKCEATLPNKSFGYRQGITWTSSFQKVMHSIVRKLTYAMKGLEIIEVATSCHTELSSLSTVSEISHSQIVVF